MCVFMNLSEVASLSETDLARLTVNRTLEILLYPCAQHKV